jgi:hypothetical protein
VTPPLPPFALIAVPNWPGVDTLLAVTRTGPVIKAGGFPPDTALRSVPLSARIPTASEPSATIGPDETVTLPLLLTATMPMPPPP